MKYILAVTILALFASMAVGYEFRLSGTYTNGKCENWQILGESVVVIGAEVITEALDEICIDDDLTQEFLVDSDDVAGLKIAEFVFDKTTMPYKVRKGMWLYWFSYRVNADQEWSEASNVIIDLKPGAPTAVNSAGLATP